VLRADAARLPPGKKENHRFEDELKDVPGYLVRARKAVTSMGLALPRYIHADPRDYFYLTLKPGIVSAGPSELGYRSEDLPHAGWPPALAKATRERTVLVRIDPARAVPSSGPVPGGSTVLAELRGPFDPPQLDFAALYATPALIGDRYAVGVPPQGAAILVRGPAVDPKTESALGVDGEGLLVYAETSSNQDGALQAALASAGVTQAVALPPRVRLGLGFREGVLAVDGTTRMRESETSLYFVAEGRPAVEVMYPDNKPMPYGRWAQLQDQRVRYFRTAAPTSDAPAGALQTGQ
jgi:hypothetical protein